MKVVGGLLAGMTLSLAAVARAEHCEPPSARMAETRALNERSFAALAVHGIAARIARADLRADVTGLQVGLAVATRHLRLDGWLPVWALTPEAPRGSRVGGRGLGDAGVRASVVLARSRWGSAGLAAAVTAPTGDAVAGLGMGHAMLMPSAWMTGDFGVWSAGLQVGAGMTMGGDLHAHSGSTGAGRTPAVDPMNPRELTGAVGLVFHLGSRGAEVGAALRGSSPVGADSGVARASAGLHVTLPLTRTLRATAGVEVPLAGAPFSSRAMLGLEARVAAF